MLNKVAVHADAIGVNIQMHPVRLNVCHAVTLLQEDNVAGHFRTGVLFEGIVRQADGTDQVSPLRQIFADGPILLVHGTLAGDEGHHAAGTNLIQGLTEKVVMDQPVVLIVPLVRQLEVAKGDIADGHIEEAVRNIHFLITADCNVAVLIQLLGDASADGIQLHAIESAVCHAGRDHAQEVTHTAGRLQNIAGAEAHLLQRPVHTADDDGRCIKSRQAAFPGGCVFFFSQ